MELLKKIRSKKFELSLIETDPVIIKMEVDSHEFLEVGDIQLLRKENLELSGGKPFCILLDTSKGYFNVSPEANKLLTSVAFSDKRIAAAFVVRSLATRLAGNFFIKLGGRRHRTHLFSNTEDAMEWLRKVAAQKTPANQ